VGNCGSPVSVVHDCVSGSDVQAGVSLGDTCHEGGPPSTEGLRGGPVSSALVVQARDSAGFAGHTGTPHSNEGVCGSPVSVVHDRVSCSDVQACVSLGDTGHEGTPHSSEDLRGGPVSSAYVQEIASSRDMGGLRPPSRVWADMADDDVVQAGASVSALDVGSSAKDGPPVQAGSSASALAVGSYAPEGPRVKVDFSASAPEASSEHLVSAEAQATGSGDSVTDGLSRVQAELSRLLALARAKNARPDTIIVPASMVAECSAGYLRFIAAARAALPAALDSAADTSEEDSDSDADSSVSASSVPPAPPAQARRR
jgi:hypothetical protein